MSRPQPCNPELKEKLMQTPAKKAWEKVGFCKHHGFNIPLASVWSKESCGIGEFFDLIPLIDWCQSIDFQVIQLLPLNDSGLDNSPYNCVSSCALNPVYISLRKLPNLTEDQQIELNGFKRYVALQRVAYHSVLNLKLEFLRKYFDETFKIDAPFESFIDEFDWLKPYGIFKVLKDKYAHQEWKHWRQEDQEPTPEHLDTLFETHKSDVLFYIFCQYIAFTQLKEVRCYAESKEILLKGDIPILISRESVDVWHFRSEFIESYEVGAHPDVYNRDGQNWQFPAYNWKEMKKNGFRIWRQRLTFAQEFYHLYRLDHVLGFYRFWVIPKGKLAKNGLYSPKSLSTALKQGEEILTSLLEMSEMLPIAEDLGEVPVEVRENLGKIGVCGTRVLLWEYHKFIWVRYSKSEDFTPLSVCTVSTHDSEPLRLWWKTFTRLGKAYCHNRKLKYCRKLTNPLLLKLLKESHSAPSLFSINLLGEYLDLIPGYTWDSPIDNRINVPGLEDFSNWSFRFRPSIEEITSHQKLAEIMRELTLLEEDPPR
ncbi:MAG: 4-alpha-glucanotransferase [Chlamydiia bacterium]|nr:4-alpha-glucanotransferase [Chlamydiia bacterium]